MAFNVAAFTRAKKLPSLESLLRKIEPAGGKRPQSVASMQAAARAWNKLLGGTFTKRAAE